MPTTDPASDRTVVAMRPYVPAIDLSASIRFYSDLGFQAFRLGDPLASLHIGRFAFLLQSSDNRVFAEQFTMHLMVSDLTAWWKRIDSLDLARRYDVQPPQAPKQQPWGIVVAYLWDPSGVQWHIAEDPAGA